MRLPRPVHATAVVLAAPALLTLPTLAGCASAPAPDAAAVERQAEAALGGAGVRSVSFSGRGTGSTFGQAWQPGIAWPALNDSVLTRVVDFDNNAFREDFARAAARSTAVARRR